MRELRSFLTRGQRNFGLEHGPLSNPLANPQISLFHCFQEVRSHQPSMQAAELGTFQALQAAELDGMCVHSFVTVCTSWHVSASVRAREDDTLRKGVVRKAWAQA